MSATNETAPISHDVEYPSPELPLHGNSVSLVTNDIVTQSPNDLETCPIVNDDDDDDDDRMPVVAMVEEEQIIEDSTQPDISTSSIIVETMDCNGKTCLDDTTPSCSSGYESSAALTNIDINIHDEDENQTNSTICSREPSTSTVSPNIPIIPLKKSKKIKLNNNRQRYKHGTSRLRSRSPTPRNNKKQRLLDDQSLSSSSSSSSSVSIITSNQIEQHLRTLFMPPIESRRTRTRSVKTPTRLVEEITPNNNNNINKTIEPDTNVFDILSSSTTTDNNESTVDHSHSCTYNVIISNKPNKLGLTIKKIVQR